MKPCSSPEIAWRQKRCPHPRWLYLPSLRGPLKKPKLRWEHLHPEHFDFIHCWLAGVAELTSNFKKCCLGETNNLPTQPKHVPLGKQAGLVGYYVYKRSCTAQGTKGVSDSFQPIATWDNPPSRSLQHTSSQTLLECAGYRPDGPDGIVCNVDAENSHGLTFKHHSWRKHLQ